MGSLHDFMIAHWNHEPTQRKRAPQERAADVSSAEPSFFCRQDAGSTLRFMGSLHDFVIAQGDHEPALQAGSWEVSTSKIGRASEP